MWSEEKLATENQATGPRSAVCIKVKSDATGTNRQLDSARVKECLKELRSRRWSSEVSVIFRAGRHQLTWAPKGRRLCRLVFYFFFSGKQRRLLAVGQAVFNGFENSRFIVLEIDSKKGSLFILFRLEVAEFVVSGCTCTSNRSCRAAQTLHSHKSAAGTGGTLQTSRLASSK